LYPFLGSASPLFALLRSGSRPCWCGFAFVSLLFGVLLMSFSSRLSLLSVGFAFGFSFFSSPISFPLRVVLFLYLSSLGLAALLFPSFASSRLLALLASRREFHGF
jgi:hypothetical protein